MSLNKIYTVPDYDMPVYNNPIRKKRKYELKPIDPFAFSHTDLVLKNKISDLTKRIALLNQERNEALSALKLRESIRNKNKLQTVKLYALRLEDDCWYIGMSYNPEKRFIRHKNGKGANWTKVHPPIEIFEIRNTDKYIQDDAAELENDMTLEYAMKYGSLYVRGGGYVQAKPKWPGIIKQNEPMF